jgi:hypothetical protein
VRLKEPGEVSATFIATEVCKPHWDLLSSKSVEWILEITKDPLNPRWHQQTLLVSEELQSLDEFILRQLLLGGHRRRTCGAPRRLRRRTTRHDHHAKPHQHRYAAPKPNQTPKPPTPATPNPPPTKMSCPVEDCDRCRALAGVRNLCLDNLNAGRPDLHCTFGDETSGRVDRRQHAVDVPVSK